VSRLFVYGLVCASLPVFRRREWRSPAEVGAVGPARFRAPAGLVLAAIGVGASVVLVARMNVREGVTMAALVALASAHWFARRRRGSGIAAATIGR
jgi:hypothetical protein